MVDKSSVLRRAEQVTFEVVAGEAILIDMNTGTYFSLNEVGTMFWEELDGQRSLAELAGLIADTYNEKSGRFVSQLRKAVAAGEEVKLEEMAAAYGMELAEVETYWTQLRAGNLEKMAADLVAQFQVPPEMVADDLLELAQKMLDDQLLLMD